MALKDKGGIATWVRWAIQEKKIVYAAVIVMVIGGILGLNYMNKDEFPTFQIKQGLVAGIYPGATADEVEEQLTKPLEETLFSYKEVDRTKTSSVTKDGICYIFVDLNCSQSQKDEVWSKIKLGLQTRKLTLPAGVLAVVAIDDFSAVSSMLVALESSDKGYTELQDYADELCVRLRKLPKLAKVSVIGEQKEEIAITLDREKMSLYGVSPTSLLMGYQTATMQLPTGSFKTNYTNASIHINGGIDTEREIAERIVYSDMTGNVIRLKDIAKIERRFKTPDNFVTYNGHNCLILSIEMRPDNNILDFGDSVNKILEEFEESMPDSVTLTKITDQPKVVGNSVWSFLRDLLISMLIVVLVMVLLFPIRSALIASTGVPVCTAIALAFMYILRIEINTVTLAALIVCLGMIVDDSIITIDGYMDKLGKKMSPVDAACASAKELFMPTFIATAAICGMFYPMTFIITGYLGDFVQLFPIVVTISLMMSLFFAVSVVPSMEIKWIQPLDPNRKKSFITRGQDYFFGLMQTKYDKMIDWCFRHPHITLWGGLIAIICGLVMFSNTNIQMMPNAARDYFVIEMEIEGGKPIECTKSYADSLERMLLNDSRVTSVTSFIGTGAPRFSATYAPCLPSPSFAQILVNTKSNKATEQILKEYEKNYQHIFPEATIRYKQMDYSGTEAAVMVTFAGDNRDSLLNVAEKVTQYMNTLDNELKWVHTNCNNYHNSVYIELDPDESTRLGVNKTMLSLSLAGTFNGQSIANIWEGDREIPVNLYSEGTTPNMTYEIIENQMVNTTLPGVSVPLRQIATVRPEWTLTQLAHKNGRESVTIYADMKLGKSQPASMRKIQKFIEKEIEPELSEDIDIIYGGLSATNKEVFPQIAWSFLAAVMVLFVFLLFHFRKASLSILTLSMSMLCLFGAFFGLWVFKQDFTITAVLGLVSLVGIIVRNGILMFEYAEDERFKHGKDVMTAAMEAGKRRMRPIFLTSCTTALGVMPMIISGDDLWMPMGIVICFGTMLSILLVVLIMPISYWQLYKKADKK